MTRGRARIAVSAAAMALGLALAAAAAHAGGDTDSSDRDSGDSADFGHLGQELAIRQFASRRQHTVIDLTGYFRLRGEDLYNLDLDAGLGPSGQPLFTVPLSGGQSLTGGDMRLRTDLAIYPPGMGVDVKLRVDVLDNLALGSTPEGRPASSRAPTPAASPGQAPPTQAFRIKRAYGEVLTPLGLLAAGRMGVHWGLGMVANGGDCDDCDGGDAADRVAFVAPVFDHFLAVAYDFTATGPVARRRDQSRPIDLEPTDNVRTVTAALLQQHSPLSRARRAAAGLFTADYGLALSHRWQDNDVPADYLPVAQPVAIDSSQLMARGYGATTWDAWVRLSSRHLRLEAEAAYVTARVEQPSLVPGVELDQAITSHQLGAAFESEVGAGGDSAAGVGALGWAAAGLDAGYASGDSAPGFGAFPAPDAAPARPGDLDGPQADLPGDTTVDNFRFHPDYRIDQILFREIIGTVTDAMYVRPHARVRLANLRYARLDAALAAIASWAAEPNSTPSGARRLGLELDPSLYFVTRDGFRVALDGGLFLPGPAFDNPAAGLRARAASLVRVRLGYFF